MITRWELITKKSGLDDAAFNKYWQEEHAPLTVKLPELRHYYQSLIIDKEQRGVSFPRCAVDADALEEIWFDNLNDMAAAYLQAGSALTADFAAFSSDVKTLLTVKSMVIELQGSPLIKRVSFIRRKDSVSQEKFKYEWWNVHGDYLRQFKGVRGYYQSLILERQIKGKPVAYKDIPIDGIVELYFDDLKALETDFSSENGKKAQVHAGSFLAEVSTYIVDKTFIKP